MKRLILWCMVASLFSGAAWAQNATYYGSATGVATVSLDSSFVSISADSGYFGAVYASAYYSTEPPNQVLPLPVAPDTTYAVADSLNSTPRYDVSNVGLSREFLLAWGNGTTKADSVTFGSMFTAAIDHPDSAVIMVRCSDSTAVSLAVIIRHVALDGTVTTIASSAVTNLRTTWQYISIPLLASFTKEEYSIEYQITAASSAWVEASRVKFVGRVTP